MSAWAGVCMTSAAKEVPKPLSVKLNMLVNAAGSLFYQGCLWLITVLVVALSHGYEASGVLAFAMTIGNMFNPIATYSIRTYQVSDTDEKYSSNNYVAMRMITILGALAVMVPYALTFSTYRPSMLCVILYLLFKCDEAFSDVLFGIYQRGERLDYSSVSQSLRGVLVVALFSLGLGVFKSLELAMLGMFVGGVLVTLLYDVWHAKRFTELAPYIKRNQTFALLRECLPVVLATLFSNAVVSVARQHFGETYGAELLGKYASVATPAVLVQALSQFLFTPVLVPLSRKWAEGSGFVAYLTKSLGLTVVLVIAVVALVALAGPWLLTTVYGPSIADSIYLLPGVLVCTVLLAFSRFLCDTLVVCRNMRGVLVSNALALVACLVLMTPIEAGQGAQGINIVVALATLAGIVASVVALVLSIKRRGATQGEAS